MVEGNQLGCVGSGNMSHEQKKGRWSSGERKAKVGHREGGEGRRGCAPQRESSGVWIFQEHSYRLLGSCKFGDLGFMGTIGHCGQFLQAKGFNAPL